jgi:hypothetical protein
LSLFDKGLQNLSFEKQGKTALSKAELSRHGSALLLLQRFWCQMTPTVPVLPVMPVNKSLSFNNVGAGHFMAWKRSSLRSRGSQNSNNWSNSNTSDERRPPRKRGLKRLS